jgi:flagellin
MLGDGAKVTISDKVDAKVTFNKGSVAGAVTDAGSAYTGAVSETLGFKVTAVEASGTDDEIKVTEIEVNGTKYSVNTDGEFDIGNGVTFEIADDASNEIGQGGTIELTAESYKMKLENGEGDVGKTVTVVNNGLKEVTVGDAATGQTATVYFDFSTMAVGSKAITQGETKSTAASVDPFGNVVTKAEVKKGINVSTQAKADKAIKVIDDALVTVSAERSMLGAIQNRLEHTIANLGTSAENLQAAESRIRDLDMADEIMAFTKNSILQQAATAMLAQANMAPQSVLQLLG